MNVPTVGEQLSRNGITARPGWFVWASLLLSSVVGCGEQPQTDARTPMTRPPIQNQRTTSGPPIDETVLEAAALPPGLLPQFEDVSASAGITLTYFNDAVPGRFFFPEIMGGGAGWFDFDQDGHLDLWLANGCCLANREATPESVVSRLFRNRGDGQFEEVTVPASVACQVYGQGCAVADFNADGFPDLYLTNYGPNLLFVNNGDGTFRDVTAESATGDPAWSTGAAWFDADADGDEDLYVVNYLDLTFENHKVCRYLDREGYCGPASFDAAPDRLYLNQTDGTFVESAARLGFVAEHGKGLSVVVVDLDDDLIPEVYVANDMTPNFLFRRSSANGTSNFHYENVAVESGCAVSGSGEVEASMGIACADFDGDARPDIFLTHYFSQKNTLYQNLGRLLFRDDSYRSRIAANSMMFLGFGTVALDYDRDMFPDLFVANGHVLGPNIEPFEMQPQFLRNEGQATFQDISSFSGPFFQQTLLGRGVAAADYDNDGDLDLLVSNLQQPVALLRNDTVTGRHFLGIQLHVPHRVAPVGGRVTVTARGRRQVQPVVLGGSYLSVSDSRLLFGLGDADVADNVEVRWPSGRVEQLQNLTADRSWVLTEGQPPRLAF